MNDIDPEILIKILHKGQKRKDGQPYTSHLYAVREILKNNGVTDPDILEAALLHDVLEDTHIKREYLAFHFGEKVAHLVFLVSKDPSWQTDYCKMKSNLDEMESEWIKYPGAIVIKMADRLHNLQTIEGFKIPKQKEYIQETEELLLSLFERIVQRDDLGQYQVCMRNLLDKIKEEVHNTKRRLNMS